MISSFVNMNHRPRISSVRRRQFIDLIRATSNTPTIVLEDQMLTYCTQRGTSRWAVGLRVPNSNRIVLKCEHLSAYSPTGSMYDRLYPWLFLRAEEHHLISPESSHVIECSVGNAGAAFAYVARELGYRDYTVILPSDIYGARIDQVGNSLGANVLLSPERIGPLGYIRCLEDMLAESRRNRRSLRESHRLCPISKIRKIPAEPYSMFFGEAQSTLIHLGFSAHIDAFVFGIGAGNTISNVGHCIKSQISKGRVVVCEHAEHPFAELLLSGSTPPVGTSWSEPDYPATTIHGVPLSKLNLDLSVIDEVLPTFRSQRDEGWAIANELLDLNAGRPTGTVLWAALRIAEQMENSSILVPVFDSASKYAHDAWIPVHDLFHESMPTTTVLSRSAVYYA